MNIILCGYKTCGKTTLAKAYSEAYHCNYLDTDDLMIEAFNAASGYQKTIGDIYHALGEQSFRKFEVEVLQSIKNIKDTIIAIGGGTVLNPKSVAYLKSLGKIIYLNVNKAILENRIMNLKVLPSFIKQNETKDELKRYLNSRDEIYQSIADYVINVNDQSIDELISMLYQYTCDHSC